MKKHHLEGPLKVPGWITLTLAHYRDGQPWVLSIWIIKVCVINPVITPHTKVWQTTTALFHFELYMHANLKLCKNQNILIGHRPILWNILVDSGNLMPSQLIGLDDSFIALVSYKHISKCRILMGTTFFSM